MGETHIASAVSWTETLEKGLSEMLQSLGGTISDDHIRDTPRRVIEAYKEYFDGVNQDPAEVLRRGFEEQGYDAMVQVMDIEFTSVCAHHLTPIFGKVNFAYLPAGRIVGLSKIPRMIEILAHRPQVQEKFTRDLVKVFQETVRPRGCAAVVDGLHFCMIARGVKKARAWTRTTALTGTFLEASVKSEFLASVGRPQVGWL